MARFVTLALYLVPALPLAGYAVGRKARGRLLRRGGYVKPPASELMRAPGTRTPGTGTTARTSLLSLRGDQWEGLVYRPTRAPLSRRTELGSTGAATATDGGTVNGPGRLARVVWPDGVSRFYDPGDAA